jgi:fibronectin type III domain protein
MNKSKILIGLLLVFLSFNFTSCEDEPIDPLLMIQLPTVTCDAPGAFAVSNFVGSSVNVTWSASEGESWEIQYGLDGFQAGSGTSMISTTTNATVNGLTSTNNYDFYIRTNCGDGLFSAWVGPVSVGSSIVSCANPTNVSALRLATITTQVNVTWVGNGDENTWEIQYGTTGFTINTGTTVSSSTTSKAITGLLATAGYDFYVRSNCTASNSNWVGPVHVNPVSVNVDTTPALMTANIDGVQFNVLRPYLYSVTQTDVIVTGLAGSPDIRYLKIQGTDNNTSINLNNSRQIDLHIPMSKWVPGTYPLFGDGANTEDKCWATLLLFTNPDTNGYPVAGTLTVTEFNLSTKRIKGTFEFTYEKFDILSVSLGIFPVTNGTFNYGLDDPYFN